MRQTYIWSLLDIAL